MFFVCLWKRGCFCVHLHAQKIFFCLFVKKQDVFACVYMSRREMFFVCLYIWKIEDVFECFCMIVYLKNRRYFRLSLQVWKRGVFVCICMSWREMLLCVLIYMKVMFSCTSACLKKRSMCICMSGKKCFCASACLKERCIFVYLCMSTKNRCLFV